MKSAEQLQDYQALKTKLADRNWRLNNLYYIKTESGERTKFKLNWAQDKFYKTLWFFNVVLKARQLGFTTFILIYFLDSCLFNRDHAAGVIAHTREDAEDLFKNKVKFAYDNLPEWIKAEISATQDTARKIEFSNGSSITVGTSLRSGTYQKLLISEYGKISARYPDKAAEIKTGALNTVHAGQQIFVESTAEGKHGEFYQLVTLARQLEQEQRKLTPLDPKFHFYAWWQHPGYRLGESDIANTSINLEFIEYFNGLESIGIKLEPGQKAWYVKKAAIQGDLMKREFPSTPDEAFEASLEGAYFTKQMMLVRKGQQIKPIRWEPSKPVDTFWDLADNRDYISIWFFQHIGSEYRFIRYMQATGEDYGYFKNAMNGFGYVYGAHYFPHDGGNKVQTPQGLLTRREIANSYGIAPITIVPRTPEKQAAIERARTILPRCFFDEVNCSEGIKLLDSYRKEWDDRNAVWKDKPRHDEASHCADAFMTFCDGYKGRQAEFIDYRDRQETYDSSYDMLNF